MSNIAFCKSSALRILRALRADALDGLVLGERVDLASPSCEGGRQRWTKSSFEDGALGACAALSAGKTVQVAVPHARDRIRTKGIESIVYSTRLPGRSFVSLGEGISISSPELLFLEMSRIMEDDALALFGMELCGRFTRDARWPRDGKATMLVPPVTTTTRIREFLDSAKGMAGVENARRVLDSVLDNTWSPTESVVALLGGTSLQELGYGLGKLILNEKRDDVRRLPDLLIDGTKVGINFDGEGHYDLESVARVGIDLARKTDEPSAESIRRASEPARKKYVDDRRRDRELSSKGYTVLVATREDLYERGGFDRLMSQVYDALERTCGTDFTQHRALLTNRAVSELRQKRVWSLLPGERGRQLSLKMSFEGMTNRSHLHEEELEI